MCRNMCRDTLGVRTYMNVEVHRAQLRSEIQMLEASLQIHKDADFLVSSINMPGEDPEKIYNQQVHVNTFYEEVKIIITIIQNRIEMLHRHLNETFNIVRR